MSRGHDPEKERCRRLFEKLSDYIDGELDDGLCAQIRGHIEGCPPCDRFLETLRRTIAAVGALPPDRLPEDLKRRICGAVDGHSGEPR